MFAASHLTHSVNFTQRHSGAKTTRASKRIVSMSAAPTARVIGKQVITSSIVISTIASVLPALAIVDDRLNGDGTGLPLGINDGALGTVLATIPLIVFALYYAAGKQDSSIIAGGKDDDSGLSL